MYNGHKREHTMKWQAVNAAIGIIDHLYGPVGKHYLIQTIMVANYYFIVSAISVGNNGFRAF